VLSLKDTVSATGVEKFMAEESFAARLSATDPRVNARAFVSVTEVVSVFPSCKVFTLLSDDVTDSVFVVANDNAEMSAIFRESVRGLENAKTELSAIPIVSPLNRNNPLVSILAEDANTM
jgi:hypothetical protein